jgi:hypothetical protein
MQRERLLQRECQSQDIATLLTGSDLDATFADVLQDEDDVLCWLSLPERMCHT